jgi:diamine N-acetyltransferase
MDWSVRRATADDAETLALVATATFLDTYAGIVAGPDLVAHCAAHNTAAKFAAWASDPRGAVVLAEAPGGAPLGYTLLTRPDLPGDITPADIELKRIYALSRTHGSGLGAALMARALQDAAALGYARVVLGTAVWNHRARAFYERNGFVLIGERRFTVGSTVYEDVVYGRVL